MSTEITISNTIDQELIGAVAQLDSWFDQEDHALRSIQVGRWTAHEVLEYIIYANRYLLSLVEVGESPSKHTQQADQLFHALKEHQSNTQCIEEITDSDLWEWPEHLPAPGQTPLPGIRKELRGQLHQCLCYLDQLHQADSSRTMDSNTIHRCVCLLVRHVKRHLFRLEEAITSPLVNWLI